MKIWNKYIKYKLHCDYRSGLRFKHILSVHCQIMYLIFIKHIPAEVSKNVAIIKINIVTIFLTL